MAPRLSFLASLLDISCLSEEQTEFKLRYDDKIRIQVERRIPDERNARGDPEVEKEQQLPVDFTARLVSEIS